MKTKYRSGKNRSGDFSNESSGVSVSSDLDEYIRVGKPGTKIVLAALLIVLVSVIVWGLIGKLPVTETVKGLIVDVPYVKEYGNSSLLKDYEFNADTVVFCFIDASRYNEMQVQSFEKSVSLETPDHKHFTGVINGELSLPLSIQECRELLFDSEGAAERCVTSDYSWWLVITPDQDISDYNLILADVTITTEEVAPISFLAS